MTSVQAACASNILGISAKSIHRANNQRLSNSDRIEASLTAKARRFDLQRTAQGILYEHGKRAEDQRRICWCYRTIRTCGETVGVYRAADGSSARFTDLTTCGSVWHCPICAAKITEARRKELDLAVTAWVKHGGLVNLLTLTFPHSFDQPLDAMLERFAKALQSFKNCKKYKKIMQLAERAGSIRSLETTWGENGWHPHTHDLVFLSKELTTYDIDTLKSEWARICVKRGLCDPCQVNDMLLHGLDVQDGRYAAEYIAKFGHDAAFGVSGEMTKPHSKVGKIGEFGGADHYTPFQLLAWAADGDKKAAALFREFGQAFEGKRMLSWSPKLRLLLTGCEHELTDETLAEHDDPAPDEVKIGTLHQDQFAILLAHNRLGDFVGYVARCCFDPDQGQTDIDDYVTAIAALPATHSSKYLKRNSIGHNWSELQAVQSANERAPYEA